MNCMFCAIRDDLKILETDNFFLLYDPFPLVSGHVLVVSKKHYGCAGEIPEEENNFVELSKIKDFVGLIIKNKYSVISFFEHGRAGACLQNGEECHHFHLHALPIGHKLEIEVGHSFKGVYFKNYTHIKSLFSSYGNYLFFENVTQDKYFFPTRSNNVPSHFFRALTSLAIGHPEKASWEKYRTSNFLELSKSDLPQHEWVKKYNDIFR